MTEASAQSSPGVQSDLDGDPQRIALVLAYDGSHFNGWQTQPERNTVQDCLEAALARITGEAAPTICAGRTDAGVHAARQVVHFDVCCRRPMTAWVRGVNSHLPAAIAVRHAAQVDASFHARYGALRRCYRYLLLSDPVRQPLLAGRVGRTHRPIDATAMSEAATVLLGEHDFSAFRSAQCQASSPVRRIDSITIEALDTEPFAIAAGAGSGPGSGASAARLLSVRFVGNAFLHHMIRNIMGALVMVGSSQRPVPWMGELLAGRDRRQGAATFDAAGLCFEGVEYDPRFGLPSWPDEP
jgi:tRNA pseudouridine38-40 synthase